MPLFHLSGPTGNIIVPTAAIMLRRLLKPMGNDNAAAVAVLYTRRRSQDHRTFTGVISADGGIHLAT